MRLEKFQSAVQKPIGEGNDHKVFVDPNREGRVIVETKEGAKQETTLHVRFQSVVYSFS